MDLGSTIADSTGRERLHVLTTEYTAVSGGRKVDEPIIHLVCRNEACEREIIEVEGYRPSFYISEAEFADRVEEVATERRVLAIEVPADPVHSATDDALSTYDHVFGATDTTTTLHDEPLVRLYCRVPGDVPELRDAFEKTWEADVPFTDRFLIDSEISTGVSIPEGAKRVRYENWPGHSESAGYKQEIEPAEKPDAPPRVLNCDIEVATEGQGMPNPARAAQPITTICAYDSYADEYYGWVQASPEWADQEDITVDNTLHTQFEEHIDEQLGRDVEMFAFTEEREMLDHFVEWVAEREFDLYTGWNSGGFDYPYIIQRAYNTSNYHIEDWSPFGEMQVWPQGEDSVGFRMKGLVPFDMLSGYEKTIWSEPRNYKLETISSVELGADQAKLEVDSFDDAWHYHPFEFMAYNVRDVEAVEGIEQARGVLDLFDNIRAVAGCDYEQAHHNISLIDVLFLRKAARQHLALPTNTVPEEGNYHGALVIDPKPGYSPTAVYPDLASMYPSILWTLNISPETFFPDEESLRAAGYTPEDAFTAYVDKRGFKVVPKSESVGDVDWDQYKGVVDTNDNLRKPPGMDDPRYDEIYYLKPDVKEGFVRDTIDELVGLKYDYKGTDLYDATKRVTNCFTPDTEVLTPSGIRNIKELEVGDTVYSFDMDEEQVEEKAVTDVHAYPNYNGELIDIESKNYSLSVTPNHDLVVTDTWTDSGYEKMEAGEFSGSSAYQMVDDWGTIGGDAIESFNILNYCDDVVVHADHDVHGHEFKSRVNGELEYEGPNRGTFQMEPDVFWENEEYIRSNSNSLTVSDSSEYNRIPMEYEPSDMITLIGWYVSEGHCYVTQSGSKQTCITQVNPDGKNAISDLLERMEFDYRSDSKTFSISSSVLHEFMITYCGTGAGEKSLPEFVFDLSERQKELLFWTLIAGDGQWSSKCRAYTTKSTELRDQIVELSLHLNLKAHYSSYNGSWRVSFSPNASNTLRESDHMQQREADSGVYCVTVEDNHTLFAGRDGKFVVTGQSTYGVLGDSNTHNKGFRLFQAELAETVTLVGRKLLRFTADAYVEHINEAHPEANVEIVGGDTDSVVNSVPGAPDYKTALEWSQEASEAFQPDEEGNPGYYDEFASEEFDIVYEEDEHRFDVEIESVASGIFFVRDFDSDNPDKAVKKRYAQDIAWEDDVEDDPEEVREMPDEGATGTWLLTPEEMQSQGITPGVDAWKPTPLEDRIGIKGFEVVRSDVSTLCTRSQEEVFRLILESPDRDPIEEYVADQVEKTKAGEIPNAWIGRPKGMSKPLDEYGRHDDGTPRSKPAPAYRGAKYADVWLDHEDILPGSKPIRFYVDRVDPTSDYPEVYTYERDGTTHYPQDSLEVDDLVDAISVEEPDRIPEAFDLDWEKMCEKELRGPLEPICRTVGLEWEDIVSEGTQSSLADW